MDSLIHALTGSLVADALPYARRLGPKAPLAGALAGILPDLDMAPAFIANFPPKSFSFHGLFDREIVNLLHRTYSHSFFFTALAAVPLGWLAWRWSGKKGRWFLWSLMLALSFFMHILLDLTNIWGVQAWLPFSREYPAWSVLPLTDQPVLLAAALVFLCNHLLRDSHPEPLATPPAMPAWRRRTSAFLDRAASPAWLGALGLLFILGRVGYALAFNPVIAG